MGHVLGIDPGITGGWAIVSSDGDLVAAGDIPSPGEGKHRMVSGALFRDVIDPFAPTRAVMEMMSSRREESNQSSLRFGQGGGILQGVVEGGVRIPLAFVAPATWKKHFKLVGSDKEPSRQLAIRRWPVMSKLFARKLDHGRAEAALIALYAIEKGAAE